jgi:hypothetical protein
MIIVKQEKQQPKNLVFGCLEIGDWFHYDRDDCLRLKLSSTSAWNFEADCLTNPDRDAPVILVDGNLEWWDV